MKKYLSVILIFLACFGFTAKLMQLDQLCPTELLAKECNEAEDHGDKDKKEKDASEQIAFHAAVDLISFAVNKISAYHLTFFSKGHVSNPYYPPDRL